MKSILKYIVLAIAVSLSISSQVNASTITDMLRIDLVSGGIFNGTVTFNDNYLGIIAASGTLTGGSNNYNETFSSTFIVNNPPTPNPSSYIAGDYTDWLVADSGEGYLGLSWSTASSDVNGLLFDLNADVTNGTVANATYPLLSGYTAYDIYGNFLSADQIGAVPEPASVALLVAGLLGFGAAYRKKNQA